MLALFDDVIVYDVRHNAHCYIKGITVTAAFNGVDYALNNF